MKFIHDYIKELACDFDTSKEIAKFLGISDSMLSAYKKEHSYNASLTVALRVFEKVGVVLHPFGKENLKYELEKTK